MAQEPYQRMLRGYLEGELRVMNAHLPLEQKSLSHLLSEEYPAILSRDGNSYLFKRKELRLLAGLLDDDERPELFLPILMEVVAGQDEMAIISRNKTDIKVITKIFGMPLTVEQNRIRIYRPQMAVIRMVLKTTTQYVFAPKLTDKPLSSV